MRSIQTFRRNYFMKYIFLSLLLISSTTSCIENIYEEISDLSHPTKEDYFILQNYLLLGSRPSYLG